MVFVMMWIDFFSIYTLSWTKFNKGNSCKVASPFLIEQLANVTQKL